MKTSLWSRPLQSKQIKNSYRLALSKIKPLWLWIKFVNRLTLVQNRMTTSHKNCSYSQRFSSILKYQVLLITPSIVKHLIERFIFLERISKTLSNTASRFKIFSVQSLYKLLTKSRKYSIYQAKTLNKLNKKRKVWT